LKVSVKALMHELQLDVEPSSEEICPYHVRFIRIFQHVAQRQQLYQALLRETGPVNIGNLMRTYFAELFQRHTLESANRENTSSFEKRASCNSCGRVIVWLNLLVARSWGLTFC